MKTPAKRLFSWLLAIAVALGPSLPSQAQEGPRSPAGSIFWHFVGRISVNVVDGTADIYGYFTTILGIPGSLFDGPPSETTALFTFRAQGSTQPLPNNGDVGIALIEPGDICVYFSAVPNHNWADPDSFSNGQLVATFARAKAAQVQVGPVIEEAHTATLVSSRDFNVNQVTLDFASLAPHGVTDNALGSAQPLSSSVFPRLTFPFAGYGFVVAGPEASQ